MSRRTSPQTSENLSLPIHIVHRITREVVRVVSVPDPRPGFVRGYNQSGLPTEAVIPDPQTDLDIQRQDAQIRA